MANTNINLDGLSFADGEINPYAPPSGVADDAPHQGGPGWDSLSTRVWVVGVCAPAVGLPLFMLISCIPLVQFLSVIIPFVCLPGPVLALVPISSMNASLPRKLVLGFGTLLLATSLCFLVIASGSFLLLFFDLVGKY